MTEKNGVERSTATEILRRLLDERGVEWAEYGDGYTLLRHGGREYTVQPNVCNRLIVTNLTPEQAIAATLGREPDDAAMAKLHDQMNAAMLKYEMAQGIEKRDGDGAIVVPWVLKMHALLEEAATLGSCNCTNDCTNGERTGTCLPHFWTHDGALHIEATRMPTRIVVCEGGTCEFVPKRELDASEAENAKLRELLGGVGYLLFALDVDYCVACPRDSNAHPCPVYTVKGGECLYKSDMRELGMEVDG